MKWTLEKDYKLLLIAMCKELSGKDYEKIAADFEGKLATLLCPFLLFTNASI